MSFETRESLNKLHDKLIVLINRKREEERWNIDRATKKKGIKKEEGIGARVAESEIERNASSDQVRKKLSTTMRICTTRATYNFIFGQKVLSRKFELIEGYKYEHNHAG